LFRASVVSLLNPLSIFQSRVDEYNKNLGKSLTWGYKWTDTSGEHKVVISLKDPDKDAPLDIKTPHLQPGRRWWTLGTQKCVWLKDYEGNFRMAVSRYDNEKAEGIKGILDLLKWDRTITSSVKAHYGINKEDIKIIERIK